MIIFIGGDENGNELLLLNEFYLNFETNLLNLIQDFLTRKGIYKI